MARHKNMVRQKIEIEADASVKKIYGDGKRIASIMNDKGKTAKWTTNNVSDAFEIAMGRKIRIKQGVASIKQQEIKTFAFYFETSGLDEDNKMRLPKLGYSALRRQLLRQRLMNKLRTKSTRRNMRP